jgi:hypothetical protein
VTSSVCPHSQGDTEREGDADDAWMYVDGTTLEHSSNHRNSSEEKQQCSVFVVEEDAYTKDHPNNDSLRAFASKTGLPDNSLFLEHWYIEFVSFMSTHSCIQFYLSC